MKGTAARTTAALVLSAAPCRAAFLLSKAAPSLRTTLHPNPFRKLFSSLSIRFCANTAHIEPDGNSRSTSTTTTTTTTTTSSPDDGDIPGGDPIKDAADLLDIRVGKVLKAWRHPEADTLYVEEVDVGDPEPRTICSGLVNYIPLQDLQDRNVVVLANLKPRNMRGVKSNGMLMAASDASHENVELLLPPEGSIPGERIWFGSEEDKRKQPDAATSNQVQKKKIWESVQPHLKTTSSCVAFLGEFPMRTSAGLVACGTLKNANIS